MENFKIGKNNHKSEICFLNIKKHTENEELLSKVLELDNEYFYSVHKTVDYVNIITQIKKMYMQKINTKNYKLGLLVLLVLMLLFLIGCATLLTNIKYLAGYSSIFVILSIAIYIKSLEFNTVFSLKKDSDANEEKILEIIELIIQESNSVLVLTDIDYVSKKELNEIFGKMLYIKNIANENDLIIKIVLVGTKKALLLEHLAFIDDEKRPYDFDYYINFVLKQENVSLSKEEFLEFYNKIIKEEVLPYEIRNIIAEYKPELVNDKPLKKRR